MLLMGVPWSKYELFGQTNGWITLLWVPWLLCIWRLWQTVLDFTLKCRLPVKDVFPIPSSITYTKAAALADSYGTAMLGVARRARLQQGETVLITAAGGGLGLAAVDIAANLYKAKVICRIFWPSFFCRLLLIIVLRLIFSRKIYAKVWRDSVSHWECLSFSFCICQLLFAHKTCSTSTYSQFYKKYFHCNNNKKKCFSGYRHLRNRREMLFGARTRRLGRLHVQK